MNDYSSRSSCLEDAHTSGLLDLGLCHLREIACLHNDRLLGEPALAAHLHVAHLEAINHRCLVSLVLVMNACLLGKQCPQLLSVDDWNNPLDIVVIPHTHFSEVARMVLVEIDSMVVLTTRISASSWVLAVLANTTVPRRHLAAVSAVLLKASGHCFLLGRTNL